MQRETCDGRDGEHRLALGAADLEGPLAAAAAPHPDFQALQRAAFAAKLQHIVGRYVDHIATSLRSAVNHHSPYFTTGSGRKHFTKKVETNRFCYPLCSSTLDYLKDVINLSFLFLL